MTEVQCKLNRSIATNKKGVFTIAKVQIIVTCRYTHTKWKKKSNNNPNAIKFNKRQLTTQV